MRNYSYNKISNTIETSTSGNLDVNDIINHYKRIGEDSSLPSDLKILLDCRNTKFIIEPEEVPLTFNELEKAVGNFNSITEAIIVDKPYETVIAVLFEKFSNLTNYSFKIFSTEPAARAWLKIN